MKLDPSIMADKSKDAEYFTPGNQVNLVTIGSTEAQGEVIVFDHDTNGLSTMAQAQGGRFKVGPQEMKLDPSTMAERNKDAEYFTSGNQVNLVTIGSRETRGEVIVFDHNVNGLSVKNPSVGQHGLHSVTWINMDYVSNLTQGEDNQMMVPDTLPYIPAARVTYRLQQSLAEKRQQRNYVGENVSPEGQLLMDSISKTITDVKWDNESIIVMESVMITPPYTVNQLRLIPGKESPQNITTLAHIRKMVDKHQQDERSRLAHSQNDTRRSTSPSPAPSSSSTSSAS